MDKRIKIWVHGTPYEEGIVVDNLIRKTSRFELVNPEDIAKSDIIFWIYGKGPSIPKNLLIWLKKDPLIINQWIGTDVVDEINRKNEGGFNRIRNFIQDCIVRYKTRMGGLINLTSAPWLVDELSKIGIDATSLPLTKINKSKMGPVDPAPVKDIDFLSYVPYGRFDFYGGDKILALAKRWPEYKFFIVSTDLQEIPPDFKEKMPKNVMVSPKVDSTGMYALYKRSKFFIRYTEHDAISLSVLEALYFNLQVLWTYEFPFTRRIETLEKLSDSIPSLVHSWQPNPEGHNFVVGNYTIESWQKKFLEIIERRLYPE